MEPCPSPLTGLIEESKVIIDFGQYEGHSVSEIKTIDPELYNELVREKENHQVAIRKHKGQNFRLYLNPLVSQSS